ncbi:MAG: cyclic nucleotide-binding domain-containing protein [Myxococcota bacterium]
MPTRERSEAIWRLLPAVRPSERPRFLFFSGLYALITMAQTIGLAGSEALFLTRAGLERLPQAMILASLVAVVGSFVYAAVVGRMRNDRLFIIMLIGAAILLAASLSAIRSDASWIFTTLFCAFYLTQAIFITHYRTFATDFFDAQASKRLFPGLAVGASLGGVLGGIAAILLGRLLGPESLVAAWGAMLLASALWLRLAHHRLRRWGPLELEELDESSVEGLRGAGRYLRRSRLARWLVISIVGMVFSLSLIHYLSSSVFVATFPSAIELAAFLGLYLSISNALEIAIELRLTPWLIQRFGVARANLVHPTLTLLSFVTLFADPRLFAALLARANREMIENAVSGEIRNLSYNALPFRFRGNMRALLEGMVFYAAMSGAGILILLMEAPVDFRLLCAAGIGTSLLYLFANGRVRTEYLHSLVAELRYGRLDLDGIESGLSGAEVRGLARHWDRLVRSERESPSQMLFSLIPLLAEHGHTRSLELAASDAHPGIRASCIEALAKRPIPALPALLARALRDHNASLRLSAARAAAAIEPMEADLRAALRECLDHGDDNVRAEAALRLGEAGLATLREMARSSREQAAVAAFTRLPKSLRDEVRGRLGDANPRVSAAALRCGNRLGVSSELTISHFGANLRHPDPLVRCAVLEALASRGDHDAVTAIAMALDDAARSVREEASTALSAMGERGVEAAAQHIGGARIWTVDAALRSLALAATDRSRQLLEAQFIARVQGAVEDLAALDLLPGQGEIALRFLRVALHDAFARNQWLALRILELVEETSVVRSIRNALQTSAPRGRADALEVLCHLGDREFAKLLSLTFDPSPVAERVASASSSSSLPSLPRSVPDLLREAQRSRDPWLRFAAGNYQFEVDGNHPPEAPTMERLLALRNVPLLASFSLEQLDALLRHMKDVQYLRGEVVMQEGEPGNELLVLLEGEAQAFKDYGGDNQTLLSTIPTGSYIGEIAILDNAPRSATVIAATDIRVLSLNGEHFKALVLQQPETCFEIFRVLTTRLRAAEARGGG